MRRTLLIVGLLALVPDLATAGKNANGAIIVHTNDPYSYSAGDVCTTQAGDPGTCQAAITQTNRDTGAVVWLLAAFLPTAHPCVSAVYFGINYDTAHLDPGVAYRFCGPAGTIEVPDPGWPYTGLGNTVAFGSPVCQTLFRFYAFKIDTDGGMDPSMWFSTSINPTGGYGAFVDDSTPPVIDYVSNYGTVRWYQPGHNDCPVPIVATGACCFPDGSCRRMTATECSGQNGVYLADDLSCEPNPCPQPEACCYPDGTCRFVLTSQCTGTPWGPGTNCSPNPCPQPTGACCYPDGHCTVATQQSCPTGDWREGVACGPNPCPPGGACCLPDGSCVELAEMGCGDRAGRFQGPGARCDTAGCAVATPIKTMVPVKINVLAGVALQAAEAEEIVKAANAHLKQAGVELMFDRKHFHQNFNEGNGDGNIAQGEEKALKKKCKEELVKSKEDGGLDGKGYKICVANALHNGSNGRSYDTPDEPVTYLRYKTGAQPEMDQRMGQTLAHEFGHVMTLSHINDPDRLMHPNSAGWDGPNILDEDEKNAIATNAPKIGHAKEPGQAPLLAGRQAVEQGLAFQAHQVRNGFWTDALDDASAAGVDLASGRIYAFDPPENLQIDIDLASFLPPSADTLDYEIGFDTDGNAQTGGLWASVAGIDKIVRIRLTGSYPFDGGTGRVDSSLRDVTQGTEEFLPAATLDRITLFGDPEAPNDPDVEDDHDQVRQSLEANRLGFSVAVVPYAVRAALRSSGQEVDSDATVSKAFQWVPPARPLFALLTGSGQPGDVVAVSGGGFAPGSEIEVRLDGGMLLTDRADGGGSFSSQFEIPQLADGLYFVTARDTTSAFDFDLLAVTAIQTDCSGDSVNIAHHQKISDTEGGFDAVLLDQDRFGRSVCPLGDLDGDGAPDMVVGADGDHGATGAIYVIFLHPNGTVKSYRKIDGAVLSGPCGSPRVGDAFGTGVASLGDLDGSGPAAVAIAVGAPWDDNPEGPDGGDRGAVWILFLDPGGNLLRCQKINSVEGGFAGPLHKDDWFGYSVASLGDLDGDGIPDLGVGAPLDDDGGPVGSNRGAAWVLFLHADGTVKAAQKISAAAGNFGGILIPGTGFGGSMGALGQGVGASRQLVTGALTDDDGGCCDRGAAWVLSLNPDGTVALYHKISAEHGGLGQTTLDPGDYFGSSVEAAGDLDGDAIEDLVVGAYGDDAGGRESGAIWLLRRNPNGNVICPRKISSTAGGFDGDLDSLDYFGVSVASLGDLDGDGREELASGAFRDDDGGLDHGAVWVLFPGDPVTSVPEMGQARPVLLAHPNPFTGSVRFEVPESGGTIEIFDSGGRWRRTLDLSSISGRTISWDGRDGAGKRMPPGLYFAKWSTVRSSSSVRLILVR